MCATKEHEYRARLEEVVHVMEKRLQIMVQISLNRADCHPQDKIARLLLPYQREIFTNGSVDTWDVTLCHAVLKHTDMLQNLDRKQQAAIADIVAARNHCAHVPGGRLPKREFDKHYPACLRAYKVFGGDPNDLKNLSTSTQTTKDLDGQLPANEATQAAERLKDEGNRKYSAKDYSGAEQCYTRGTNVTGAVTPMVLSQLYSNRSAVRLQMKDYSGGKFDARRAAELSPQWAKPQVRLAEIYFAQSKYAKATTHLQIAQRQATAAKDDKLLDEIDKKLKNYRLKQDGAQKRADENSQSDPIKMMAFATAMATAMAMQFAGADDPLIPNPFRADSKSSNMSARTHVRCARQASEAGRFHDAAKHYEAAAKAGNLEGMYEFAQILENGSGLVQDVSEAIRWYEKVAEVNPSGDKDNVYISQAMLHLGSFSDRGEYIKQDKQRALEYWTRAADLGEKKALNQVGVCFIEGTHGLTKDFAKARDLFRRGAELMDIHAMGNLAALHETLQDFESGARWADTAARFGDPTAVDTAKRCRKFAALKRAHEVAATVRAFVEVDTVADGLPPTLDSLRQIDTPYGKRLHCAKALMQMSIEQLQGAEGSLVLTPMDTDRLYLAIWLAAQAHRAAGCDWVFSNEEEVLTSRAAATYSALGHGRNAAVVLSLGPSVHPTSAEAFWKLSRTEFPGDNTIAYRTACACMEVGSTGECVFMLKQVSASIDAKSPLHVELLYSLGVAYFSTEQFEHAEIELTRFLDFALTDGHALAPDAMFLRGMIKFWQGLHQEFLDLVEQGLSLLQQMPRVIRAFARTLTGFAMMRAALESAPRLDTLRPTVPLKQHASTYALRGGDLLAGPKRHEQLKFSISDLQLLWREEMAAMAKHTLRSWTTQPTHSTVQTKRVGVSTPATIDELFSGLQDKVYVGREIECIVISTSCFNGCSVQFIVEDSQREAARVALYNASTTLQDKIRPGRVLLLHDPYVRIAQDGKLMLRVDDPTATLTTREPLHAICWHCGIAKRPQIKFFKCRQCLTAHYCSKTCQREDLTTYGHDVLCKTLQKQRK